MANTLLTIGGIIRETLRILENDLGVTRNIRREYDDKFAVAGAKIGDVLNLRKPPRMLGAKGQALAIEDMTETSVPLTLSEQAQGAMAFSTADMALSIDDFAKRFIKPGVAMISNTIDLDATLLYQQVYNVIGTPGTVPNATLTYLQAGQRLSEEAAPQDERVLTMTPAMNATIVDAVKGVFNPQSTISEFVRKGMMAKNYLGFDWYMDQNLRTHTIGALGGTPVVNGAGQTGSNLVTNGWTAAAAQRLNPGDWFTIAGVFAVNPQSRQSTGALRQFVVTAPVSSDGGGNATIPIYPAIVTAGAFQTVSASPGAGAAITVGNGAAGGTTTPQGLAFHPEAFAFGCADLPLPKGVHMADRVASRAKGLSIRVISAYDINLDRMPTRLDVLYGFAAPYPELAVRVAS